MANLVISVNLVISPNLPKFDPAKFLLYTVLGKAEESVSQICILLISQRTALINTFFVQ